MLGLRLGTKGHPPCAEELDCAESGAAHQREHQRGSEAPKERLLADLLREDVPDGGPPCVADRIPIPPGAKIFEQFRDVGIPATRVLFRRVEDDRLDFLGRRRRQLPGPDGLGVEDLVEDVRRGLSDEGRPPGRQLVENGAKGGV